jgi:hypothetical protein
LGSTGVCVVNSDCVVPVEGAETVNVAVALVSPVAEAVTVAVPVLVAVKRVVATPFPGVTGEAGLKEPETPLTANVIGLVALVTRLPLALRMAAVYVIATAVCVLALAGVSASLVGCASVTVNTALALLNPAAVTVIVAVPAVVAVKLQVAMPPLGVIGLSIEFGLNEPETPLTEKVTGLLAVVTVFP